MWSVCFTLVQQLHAVQRGQGGEQAGVQTHGQQVPQAALIQGLASCRVTTTQHTAQGSTPLITAVQIGSKGNQGKSYT